MKIAFVLALAAVAVAKPTDISEEKQKELQYKKHLEGDIRGEKDFIMGALNAMVDPARCWQDATIPYVLKPGDFTPQERNALQYAMNDLIDSAKVEGKKCIDIIQRTTQTDYVNVYKDQFSCFSYVGRIGGAQDLGMPAWCAESHGSILHEFLHAFGFYHEQSRSDRDEYVIVHWDNIEPGAEHNFDMYESSEINLLNSLYDYESVMHYPKDAFAVDPASPTLETVDPAYQDAIGQREGLGVYDIERLQLLYGCITPANSKHFKHVAGRDVGMCKPQIL